jgi:hypothetical protein
MYQRYKGRGKYTNNACKNKITRLFQVREKNLILKWKKENRVHLIALLLNKTGEVRINVILRRVRVTTVAVENQ